MSQKKRPPQKTLTREQELLQDFQQAEAAAERDQLEPVDSRIQDERRTWAEMAEDAGYEEPESWAPWASIVRPKGQAARKADFPAELQQEAEESVEE